MGLNGNVRILNVQNEKFLTNQIFWDQRNHKVYSDSFIHIERSDRIIEGYGFESNEKMTTYTVTRPSGIFPVSDFRGGARDSSATDSVTVERSPKQHRHPRRRRLMSSPFNPVRPNVQSTASRYPRVRTGKSY